MRFNALSVLGVKLAAVNRRNMKRAILIFLKCLFGVYSPSLRRKIRLSDLFNKSYRG